MALARTLSPPWSGAMVWIGVGQRFLSASSPLPLPEAVSTAAAQASILSATPALAPVPEPGTGPAKVAAGSAQCHLSQRRARSEAWWAARPRGAPGPDTGSALSTQLPTHRGRGGAAPEARRHLSASTVRLWRQVEVSVCRRCRAHRHLRSAVFLDRIRCQPGGGGLAGDVSGSRGGGGWPGGGLLQWILGLRGAEHRGTARDDPRSPAPMPDPSRVPMTTLPVSRPRPQQLLAQGADCARPNGPGSTCRSILRSFHSRHTAA